MENVDKAARTEREPYLDAIKAFALLMVFALHTQRGEQVTDPCYNAVFFYGARCCMPLFFMVNGSLILSRDTFDLAYYRKKMVGIGRVLLYNGICIGLYVWLFHGFTPWMAVKEMAKGFLSYTNYAFLWFLYAFAILYTVLLFGFIRIKKNLNKIVAATGAVCLTMAFCSVLSIWQGGYFVQSYVTQRLRLWTWLFYFCLGYKLRQVDISRYAPHRLWIATPVLAVISIGWQYYLCWHMTGQVESNCMYDDISVMLYSAAVFLCFRTAPRLSKRLGGLAGCGFGAFLIHGFLVDAFSLRSMAQGPGSAFLVWALLVASCWTLSWILGHVPGVRRILRY